MYHKVLKSWGTHKLFPTICEVSLIDCNRSIGDKLQAADKNASVMVDQVASWRAIEEWKSQIQFYECMPLTSFNILASDFRKLGKL